MGAIATCSLRSAAAGTSQVPSTAAAAPRIGDCVGSYRLLALLGAGSMGRVFRAQHVRLGRTVALKLLDSSLVDDTDATTRFLYEAKVATVISHPGLVDVFDLGFLPGGVAYFAMELLEGVSLKQLLQGGPLSIDRALRIAQQVAATLCAIHDHGVVHRDLKPANLVIVQDEIRGEVVKVIDFGIAKFRSERLSAMHTAPGAVLGTPAYISPEQAAGSYTDDRADVYAVGVILYQMLSGRLPFPLDAADRLLEAHQHGKPAPLTRVVHGRAQRLPRRLVRLVDACLHKVAARRPSAVELREELGVLRRRCRHRAAPSRLWRTAAVATAGLLVAGSIALLHLLPGGGLSRAEEPSSRPLSGRAAYVQAAPEHRGGSFGDERVVPAADPMRGADVAATPAPAASEGGEHLQAGRHGAHRRARGRRRRRRVPRRQRARLRWLTVDPFAD